MRYTVKKLAKLSGVSVRALHFYDEIGLLAPAYYGDNGYRYYEEAQLLKLQQLLFFRELGLPLDEIKKIITSAEFDTIAALESHRKVLHAQAERAQSLLLTIDRTLARLKGEHPVKAEELYLGFDPAKQDDHEKYLVSRYGNKTQSYIDESKRRTRDWTKADYDSVKAEVIALNEAFTLCLRNGTSADSTEVQDLTRRHYEMICRFYDPSREVYAGLGQLYVDHPEFRKLYETFHPRLAEYLADAMKTFAAKNLEKG